MNKIEHLLECLAEEGGEVAKECHKANRFGLDDQLTVNPYGPRGTEGPTNRQKLIDELNDLLGVARLLVDEGVIPHGWQNESAQLRKKDKVRSFMYYAQRVGALQVYDTPTQQTED